MNKQTKIIVLTVISILIIAIVGFFLLSSQRQSIQSYAECIKSKDSTIQTSYPTVCVTKDNKRFSNPDEKVTTP